jgi:hypothetical protein
MHLSAFLRAHRSGSPPHNKSLLDVHLEISVAGSILFQSAQSSCLLTESDRACQVSVRCLTLVDTGAHVVSQVSVHGPFLSLQEQIKDIIIIAAGVLAVERAPASVAVGPVGVAVAGGGCAVCVRAIGGGGMG